MWSIGFYKNPYDFVSKGPSDVYELYGDVEFDDLLDKEDELNGEEDQIEESVNKSLDMFRRFNKYN